MSVDPISLYDYETRAQQVLPHDYWDFIAGGSKDEITTQRNRNVLRNPGQQNWNAGLLKRFPTVEGQDLIFRFEAFNFINHPNLAAVDANPTSSTFGRVVSKTGQRQMQVSLRYTF